MTKHSPISLQACSCDDVIGKLPTVSEALEAALSSIVPLADSETVLVSDATGRVLSAPVVAQRDMPRFDCSAMDGYALRAADATNTNITVQGVVAAGQPSQPLHQNAAMRIYTGAPIPEGADTVVMQENVQLIGRKIALRHPPASGDNIRRAGEDQRVGNTLIAKGTRLAAHHIGITASAGHHRIDVFRKPKIALLLTGDELISTDKDLKAGAIWDANGPMIAAYLREAGCELIEALNLPDCPRALLTSVENLAACCDMIITSGGASVGDRDFLHDVLQSLGAKIHVKGVAMKPGKPVISARFLDTSLLALPGNPLAALTIWQIFGRNMVNKLSGECRQSASLRMVKVTTRLDHKLGRDEYRPATLSGIDQSGVELVTCPSVTHSARLSQAQTADGFLLFPANCETLYPGDLANFLPLC